jgi:signal transduction histidine kinase
VLQGEVPRVVDLAFAGNVGRWEMHRTTFRQEGKPHTLVVLSDLSRALREEERQVWQRLIRVLGHELNNSLAPIKSIAGSLQNVLKRRPLASDWEEDMDKGLNVIAVRAEALSNFMNSYSRLARLPQPKLQPVEVSHLLKRVLHLEQRLPIRMLEGPSITVEADPDQMEQLLINLLQNAVDASIETGGEVILSWSRNGEDLEVKVEDQGPGLSGTENLFVPFFTTKSGGSGIGLVLSRQIAEAHGGNLILENRPDGPGCRAVLHLPLDRNLNAAS